MELEDYLKIIKEDRAAKEKAIPPEIKKKFNIGAVLFGGGLLLLFIWMFCVTVVPAGSVGVKDTFGNVDPNVFQSGIYLKLPITDVVMMSTRTMKYIDYGNADTATITALSNDGLSTSMGVAVNYHINPVKAPEVYKNVGIDYPDVVMVNPIHSVPRDLISKYDTKTLYSASREGSTDRAKIEQELFDGIQSGINEMGVKDSIVIEQVSIRNIDFPAVYKTAIEQKMKMDTEIQQKELEVKKQDMESNRMRSEAQGIADSNKIIANSLSESYLEWYWIESMKNNPKTIYVPTNNGLPLFKDVDSSE
jgi:regulator of protease activity HflC (stomatin/prohibitin superfamily)